MEREFSDEEMRANYAAFRAFVYAKLRERLAGRQLPEGDDLEKIARDEGAVPLEEFLQQLEKGE